MTLTAVRGLTRDSNAEIIDTPLAYTAPGWESPLATNHRGRFALAVGLHDTLVEGSSARVVSEAVRLGLPRPRS